MKRLLPFDRASSGARQTGSFNLAAGMIAILTTVIGGQVVMDRISSQRKANRFTDQMAKAKEVPGSASIVAKALISLPPHVAANKSVEWTTDKIVNTPANLPRIYPVPYVSGVDGQPAQSPVSVAQLRAPEAGENWATVPQATVASNVTRNKAPSVSVYVFTNDGARANVQDVGSAIGTATLASGSESIRRSRSLVTYTFQNCTPQGQPSAAFTGNYCGSVFVQSPNYALSAPGVDVLSGENRGGALLGVIATPPAPNCGTIVADQADALSPGETFALDVQATGVATGYEVWFDGVELLSSGSTPLKLPWDDPRSQKNYTISNIPTLKVKDKLGALVAAGSNQATFDVILKGINGANTHCPAMVNLPGPVSCVLGSLETRRVGYNPSKCEVKLKKDNGPGTVTKVVVSKQDTMLGTEPEYTELPSGTAQPAFNQANEWSQVVDCSDNDMTISAVLRREAFGKSSESKCNNASVEELEPICDTSSLDKFSYNRKQLNQNKCSVIIHRDLKSHAEVDVVINGNVANGTWNGLQWEGERSCGPTDDPIEVALVRGEAPDQKTSSCGKREVEAVPLCKSNSMLVKRNSPDSDVCKMTVEKEPAADLKNVSAVLRDWQAATGSFSGNLWSGDFNCGPDAAKYHGHMVGGDGKRHYCGFSDVPKREEISCTLINVSRKPSRPHICDISLSIPQAKSPNPAVNITTNGTVSRNLNPRGWIGTNWSGSIRCSLYGDNIGATLVAGTSRIDCGASYVEPRNVCRRGATRSVPYVAQTPCMKDSVTGKRDNCTKSDVTSAGIISIDTKLLEGDVFADATYSIDDLAFVAKPSTTFPAVGRRIALPIDAIFINDSGIATGYLDSNASATFTFNGKSQGTVGLGGEKNYSGDVLGQQIKNLGIPIIPYNALRISQFRDKGYIGADGILKFKLFHVVYGLGYVYMNVTIPPCE